MLKYPFIKLLWIKKGIVYYCLACKNDSAKYDEGAIGTLIETKIFLNKPR